MNKCEIGTAIKPETATKSYPRRNEEVHIEWMWHHYGQAIHTGFKEKWLKKYDREPELTAELEM